MGDSVAQNAEKRKRNFVLSEGAVRGRLAYPLAFVWEFVFGVGSEFFSRFAAANLITSSGETDDMMMDVGLASALAFCIKVMMRSTDPKLMTTSMVGVFVCVSIMHNRVWTYPFLFALGHGELWVEALSQRSDPHGIFFRAMYILIE